MLGGGGGGGEGWVGGGGAGESDFFTMNPDLKYFFRWGEAGAGLGN